MYILALETSTKNFSLALSKDEKLLRYRNVRTAKILETSIIPEVDKLLVSCGLTLKNIDVLAVGLGPGSFTSLRVGLSTIKAFAFSQNKKVVGIGSLDLIASGTSHPNADEICGIVDARRQKVYAAIYDQNLNRKTDYLLTTIDDVLERVHGTTLFVGDALGLYQEHIQKAYQNYNSKNKSECRPIFASEKFWFPRAQELAKLAFKKIVTKEFVDPEQVVPIYLYPQDCQVDRK